jgi:vacuolar-type H+-ATPase subunit E/Vma4
MNVSMSRLFKGNDKQTNEPKPASAPTAAGARAPDERAQSAQSARVPTKPRGPDPDQASIEVGDQVATILASAKQAAEQLQLSARDDAKRIRGEAKQEAATRAQALERELAGKREEGAKLHAEAQAYSKRTREAADHYAAETRRRIDKESGKRHQEAEREANEIRTAARQQVETLSSEAVRRQKALTAETQRSEARLRQLLGVFRALTAQLEDLLGDERATASSADGPNLEEALKPPPLKDRPVQRARSADYAGHEDPDRDA